MLRELPIPVLVYGDDIIDDQGNQIHLTGCEIILRALERRYGAMEQEVAIHVISELMGFRRNAGESTDEVLARFEVLLHRAGAIAGVQFGPQLRAWLLLNHLRIPRAAWHIILSPTLGRLPSNPDEYANFCQYVRRNGHLHEKSGDDQKNMSAPYYASSEEPAAYWSEPSTELATWTPTYMAEPGTANDDGGDWQRYSTGQSDEGEPIDWSDWNDATPDAHVGECLYLAYRSVKRKWRSFAGPSRGRSKGRGKGKGKPKGKGTKTFWTDDSGNHYPINTSPEYQETQSTLIYFKERGKAG